MNIFKEGFAFNFSEREKKLQELRSRKSEYTEGMWNVNSVLMGGLGNDPQLEGKLILTDN